MSLFILKSNNFLIIIKEGVIMKKVYECSLLQVSNEQGYIISGNGDNDLTDVDAKNLFYPYDQYYRNSGEKSDVYFGQILVTKTINKFVVKEIRTGKLIPVIYGIYRPDDLYNSRKRFTLGQVHTFISNVKTIDSYISMPEYSGLEEVTDLKVIEDYLKEHKDKEKFMQELDIFFKNGEIKMQEKIALEKESEKLKEKEKTKIKKIFKK